MKRLIWISMTAAAMSSVSSSVQAVPAVGQIDFTGEIITAVCSIQNSPLTVDLGRHHTSQLDQTTRRFLKTNFTVTLTGCPDSNGATMQFTGMAAQNNPQLLAVAAPPGQTVAGNVGIRLFDTNQTTPLNLNSDSTPVNLTAGNNNVDFAAAYEQIGNNPPTAGQANGTATLDITYN